MNQGATLQLMSNVSSASFVVTVDVSMWILMRFSVSVWRGHALNFRGARCDALVRLTSYFTADVMSYPPPFLMSHDRARHALDFVLPRASSPCTTFNRLRCIYAREHPASTREDGRVTKLETLVRLFDRREWSFVGTSITPGASHAPPDVECASEFSSRRSRWRHVMNKLVPARNGL